MAAAVTVPKRSCVSECDAQVAVIPKATCPPPQSLCTVRVEGFLLNQGNQVTSTHGETPAGPYCVTICHLKVKVLEELNPTRMINK